MELPYKTALVTGASSGLGRGLTKWFARRGVHVYAAARREEQLQELAREAEADGGKVTPVSMDVANAADTRKRIEALDEACGGLDLVIANAGVGIDTPVRRLKWEHVARTIDVNVTGAAATLTAALPKMLERDRGHLVGVASLASYRGIPGSAAYSASKAFLATFLEGLRVELSATRVRVTSLHPGFVKSEMTAKNTFKMPFILETDRACELMAGAILRAESEYAFPWQMSSAMKVMKWMPNSMWNAAARKLR